MLQPVFTYLLYVLALIIPVQRFADGCSVTHCHLAFITVLFVIFWTRLTSTFSATLMMLMTRVSKHGAFYPLWDGKVSIYQFSGGVKITKGNGGCGW